MYNSIRSNGSCDSSRGNRSDCSRQKKVTSGSCRRRRCKGIEYHGATLVSSPRS
ncbi:hypothetical protein BCR41DRAFT_358908 [Lobosporangium transversale]|uniref:Uncharacterized protein n=1 Tax=Lobosporangium transversale TaxID=64571 RepID=A0A1Y2GF94_9FUNG|nr:hypothetical protein BCR41DRAFT_358908 [Lobosporangium transversale]ORZ09124.1 hypothetical protein BCR41DRAFT_358908 [Lobosporangium transversale]|eukprot:XP_021878751.1 hypothetical protein BCR41DRAFT_358908 [Lobosporangium transversale]